MAQSTADARQGSGQPASVSPSRADPTRERYGHAGVRRVVEASRGPPKLSGLPAVCWGYEPDDIRDGERLPGALMEAELQLKDVRSSAQQVKRMMRDAAGMTRAEQEAILQMPLEELESTLAEKEAKATDFAMRLWRHTLPRQRSRFALGGCCPPWFLNSMLDSVRVMEGRVEKRQDSLKKWERALETRKRKLAELELVGSGAAAQEDAEGQAEEDIIAEEDAQEEAAEDAKDAVDEAERKVAYFREKLAKTQAEVSDLKRRHSEHHKKRKRAVDERNSSVAKHRNLATALDAAWEAVRVARSQRDLHRHGSVVEPKPVEPDEDDNEVEPGGGAGAGSAAGGGGE